MLLSLSSDGSFQKTQPPDVHLVSVQEKYAPLHIFHLAFSDVFTAMFVQLKIFWLGLVFCWGFCYVMFCLVLVLGFFFGREVVLTQQWAQLCLQKLHQAMTQSWSLFSCSEFSPKCFFNSFGRFWFMESWLNKETGAAESICCCWGSTSSGSWQMLAQQQLNLTVAKVIL